MAGTYYDSHNFEEKPHFGVSEEQNPALAVAYEKNQSDVDHRDMQRLGKRQEFKRTFGFWPTFGFTSIYIATWEYLLVSVYSGLVNGGFGGLIYEYIATSIFYFSVVLSLAEMASMAPTSGGQYHWVSEFAPPSMQRYLSYASGWTIAMGWLTGAASGSFIMYTLVQALVQIYIPNFSFTNWQGTLVMIAFVIIQAIFNTVGARLLPMIENISLVGHVAGWIITIVPLWVLAPKNSAHDVFIEVKNSAGWGSNGLSYMVGTVAILYCQLGPDAAVHIAEEVRDASVVLPRCMIWGYLYNAVLGLIMLITMLFTVGSLDDAINADAPFQNAFANTGSKAINTVLTLILVLLIGSGNITAVTTASRETWALARDGGTPFHHWIGKVSTRFNATINATWLTAGICIILALINIGSDVAFTIIVSLNLVAFLSTYLLSIGCVLWKRIYHPEQLPPARWSMGRWGIPVNIIACGYSILAFVLSCFPVQLPVDAASANFAPAIFAAVLVIALLSFIFHGRKNYEGPVVFVEGRKQDGVGLQTTG